MSSITFAPAAPVTRLRITARGRRVLAALVAVPLSGALVFAALSGGAALASGDLGHAQSFETVTVQPGDTLWSIAGDIAPEADPRDVVADISRLNVIQAGALSVGQHLAIPAQYSSH
ncbi:LysM peptidoglycan-binding domain-containing protein [uncultured Microbacterium sp.]|uniref:LysM peptidoglycan-binding domain-containing protein n=1 Tax=uncultured Microbacterium sp. TaxID=191216 RepID=UPI0025E1D40B|nr:LysM peptidoglycan-binding domain-containing protein [uncultured Microbacterium sp.]